MLVPATSRGSRRELRSRRVGADQQDPVRAGSGSVRSSYAARIVSNRVLSGVRIGIGRGNGYADPVAEHDVIGDDQSHGRQQRTQGRPLTSTARSRITSREPGSRSSGRKNTLGRNSGSTRASEVEPMLCTHASFGSTNTKRHLHRAPLGDGRHRRTRPPRRRRDGPRWLLVHGCLSVSCN